MKLVKSNQSFDENISARCFFFILLMVVPCYDATSKSRKNLQQQSLIVVVNQTGRYKILMTMQYYNIFCLSGSCVFSEARALDITTYGQIPIIDRCCSILFYGLSKRNIIILVFARL